MCAKEHREESGPSKEDSSISRSESASAPTPDITHTLFQISTSGALVAGLYNGVVSTRVVLAHGDFGLGTFAGLDGEMVVLDGRAYRVRGDGAVSEVAVDAEVPFAVVTRFDADIDEEIRDVSNLGEFEKKCDVLRVSSNIFYALRIDGTFSRIRTRAVSPPPKNGRLIDAAKVQAEFEFNDIAGTLVGIWSPGFSSAFSVPGYHFHFVSDSRTHGGHLLACSSEILRVRAERLTDFHLVLPTSESYLKADLSKNSADELAYAEQSH
ncbi:acetolactate decarboxylase [Paraburkholderia pallida]|uniref:Alpha-acetolactate decarboxylase n=1 Tax=Paraburkholderia pallida TaxID=2547399 RepID=A0A4P7D4D8_9BURK|nr:acetolactate decarboxylase [Paraburkholderia pallida]QBR03641.1 acetolactate decarboxylase [Paraburkholderia pallida]